MNELTREIRDRRIALAHDLLRQMGREDNRLMVERGNYVEGSFPLPAVADLHKLDVRDVVEEMQQHCEVCAKGALFLSYARLFDQMRLVNFVDFQGRHAEAKSRMDERITKALSDTFSGEELDHIEARFEGWRDEYDYVSNAYAALAEIAQEIIDGDGSYTVSTSD